MIPGFIVTWLTFPGVIIHELAHKIFCHLTGTGVIQVCYFRFGNPSGYVIHDIPSSPWKHLLIGFGPLIVNTLLGLGIAVLSLPLRDSTEEMETLYYGLMWLAISIATHAFPSTGDAASIWHGIWKKPSSILTRIIGTPLVALIYLGALGSAFWLDLLYGIGVCVGLPDYWNID